MAPLNADDWLAAALADEGWQAPLSEPSRESVVVGLEGLLPPGATLSEAEAAGLLASLQELSVLVERLRAGCLDEAALVGAWMRVMRV
ncbi:MAG: hypothetical protein VKQ33_15745 [Candidatus Sericytochromatia bacterium]|nr:hypothetical protein [Candidatus Sericytochromatia bacterium]